MSAQRVDAYLNDKNQLSYDLLWTSLCYNFHNSMKGLYIPKTVMDKRKAMKLLEALKNCTIINLDEDEKLLIISENWDAFYHNLTALISEEGLDQLVNIEVTSEVMKLLEANETDDLCDDGNINSFILDAAWLTANGFDYAVCEENDEYDELHEDWHEYSFTFTDPEFSYIYECDVDLT